VRASFPAHGSSVIYPLSWAPYGACDLHVGASPSRVIHTSLNGVLTASAALLVPITYISPSPRQHIRWLSQRPWLLGASHPVPYAVDTCSSWSTTEGYSVPYLRITLHEGPHSSPGFSGVYLGQLQTCPALILAVLAQAHNPRRLAQAHDDSIMGSCAYPYATLLDGIPGRIPSDQLLSPLCGLMVSRYRRGYAFTSTPEGQELHLHEDTVIKDRSI
jgi:hypothetical protein